MQISLVIPVYNEAGNIGALIDEANGAIDRELLAEIIVVDDCSSDETVEEVKAKQKDIANLRLLKHRKNAGQSAALRTGIWAAKSDIIAQIDGDGQNDPADIPKLCALLCEAGGDGTALVGGVRTKRRDTGSKRWASKMANAIRQSFLRDGCPDTGCGTKVYWRGAYLRLPFFTSLHRFLPALFIANGYKVAYHPVNDRPRRVGVSKYNNFNRAMIGLRDLFGVRWLRARTANPESDEL